MMRREEDVRPITAAIVDGAVQVHRALGSGLLESAYEAALCRELELRGLQYRRQVVLEYWYKGAALGPAYVLDLLVEESVVVELKAIDATVPVHKRQLLTYLRLAGCRYGLLLNFGAPRMIEGVTRMVDGY